jgi:hypothetical protein
MVGQVEPYSWTSMEASLQKDLSGGGGLKVANSKVGNK